MIPSRRTSKAPLQVPQSPLMSEANCKKQKAKAEYDAKISPQTRPLTPKITRKSNPMGDFYWGDAVQKKKQS